MFQSVYGAPDAAATGGDEKINEYLKTAWEHVEDIHRAFESWDQNRTGDEMRDILDGYGLQISELARMRNEAKGMDDVDWRISLFQDAMDDATHKLTRRLPGMSVNELQPSGPIFIKEAVKFPLWGTLPSRHDPYSPDSNFKANSHRGEDYTISSRIGSSEPRATLGDC